jgi:septal ring factor EnvC (AmiA/AmiB activator)
VRRRLDAAREQASAARRREASLLAELETIDRTLARKRQALQGLDRRLREVAGELASLEGRRDRVAEDRVSQHAALSLRLAALARLRSAPAPPGWLVDAEALARRRAVADLARVVGADLAVLARADAAAERLASRQEAVARARGRLVVLRRAADAERAAIEAQAERRRRLLADARADRTTHERLAAELAEAARRLERLVRALARRPPPRKAVARPAAPRPPAVGLGRERGRLPWPTEGRVVAGFGREVHPRFGTEVLRSGIVIEAPEGAAIRAVAPGTVAYRGWLRGYGNLIVLDHGNGYHTLYAHASEVLVEEGDQVTAGELIGRVGESGSVEGPRLHFELRHQSRAEDPRDWLRRRP